jgi:type II secretory ATPase GspE/PulE/Tfp pilus assembly ATPase PilB-like protein
MFKSLFGKSEKQEPSRVTVAKPPAQAVRQANPRSAQAPTAVVIPATPELRPGVASRLTPAAPAMATAIDGATVRKLWEVPEPTLHAAVQPSAEVIDLNRLPHSGFAPTDLAVAPINSFTALPKFQVGLLSQGDDAVHRVSPGAQSHLAALNLGAMKCVIVRAVGLEGEQRKGIELEYRALTTQLRANGYTIEPDLVATQLVLHEIQRVSSNQTRRSKSRAIELFWRWVELGVKEGATDLHIEMHGQMAEVRARIDGELEPIRDGQSIPGRYPAKDASDAVAAAFNDSRTGANNPNYEASKFIDCMVPFDVAGASGYLRYQNIRGRLGAKVVVRILRNHADTNMSLANAGYAPSHLKLWRTAGRAGRGMIITAGRVGSGKSTSQCCFLQEFPNRESKALYTVEDPIEQELDSVHQIEVLRDLSSEEETKRRYSDVMRALMRGDLDAVAVGEIRDHLTANFALTIGETGHLAMGTIHTHGVASIVPRLTNVEVGLTRDSLTNPGIINTFIYQALVPLVCPKCSLLSHQAAQDDLEVAEALDQLRNRFKVPTERLRWQNPIGCSHCNGRGTKGKTIVAEMLQPDRRWLELVRAREDYQALMHYRSFSDRDFLSENMNGKTVFEHALFKALQGQIDVRNLNEFDALERFEILEAE